MRIFLSLLLEALVMGFLLWSIPIHPVMGIVLGFGLMIITFKVENPDFDYLVAFAAFMLMYHAYFWQVFPEMKLLDQPFMFWAVTFAGLIYTPDIVFLRLSDSFTAKYGANNRVFHLWDWYVLVGLVIYVPIIFSAIIGIILFAFSISFAGSFSMAMALLAITSPRLLYVLAVVMDRNRLNT